MRSVNEIMRPLLHLFGRFCLIEADRDSIRLESIRDGREELLGLRVGPESIKVRLVGGPCFDASVEPSTQFVGCLLGSVVVTLSGLVRRSTGTHGFAPNRHHSQPGCRS